MASLSESESFLQAVVAAAAATAAQIAQLTANKTVDQCSSQAGTSELPTPSLDEPPLEQELKELEELKELQDLQELKELQEHLNCGSNCPIKLRSRNYTDIVGRRPIHTPKSKATSMAINKTPKSTRARRSVKTPKSSKKLKNSLKIGYRGGTPKKASPPSMSKKKLLIAMKSRPVTQRRALYTRKSPKLATKRKADDPGPDGASPSKRMRCEKKKTRLNEKRKKCDSSLSDDNQQETPQIIDRLSVEKSSSSPDPTCSVPELPTPRRKTFRQAKPESQYEADSTSNIMDLSQTLMISEIQDADDSNQVTLTYERGQQVDLLTRAAALHKVQDNF
ncbi:PREDICTED: uncharacterized protein LOC108609492 [Drosophila arizonae]|uniref:Uncharacterized protein LOC108609492 n=1 Tax=Drosophila arizonae TaxID=7263 RepID=A0ABM1NP16_DROAR|nr:PREDICTED: uncharacterized protein LOC108609492 [Drosophila arizonae]